LRPVSLGYRQDVANEEDVRQIALSLPETTEKPSCVLKAYEESRPEALDP
jgi:hypothetical protein